jgi:mRNA interferase RelE/StbE
MTWRVEIASSAERDLRRLDRPVAARVLDALSRFAETGEGDVRRVLGVEGVSRLRVGDWRVLFRYAPTPQTIVVLRIRPRGEAYR